MLTHLSIQNFTLVDSLELEFLSGMTAITGETGAGKSILLNALGLTLGDRAEPDLIRNHQDKADICATFNIQNLPEAKEWLVNHDLADNDECILRRVITSEGRSRGYINGQPTPLTQLKQLGEMLIDIHSQHAHQSLLKRETHRRLLDDYGHLQTKAQHCRQLYLQWQKTNQELQEKLNNSEESSARAQLLQYQIQELDLLALSDRELEQLELEQKQLSNAESTILLVRNAAEICDNDDSSILSLLHTALQQLGNIEAKPKSLEDAYELLNSAAIQVQEATSELNHFIDAFDADPIRLQQVEERLSSCYDIARKHRIQPTDLLTFHQQLRIEIDQLGSSETQLEKLQEEVTKLRQEFMEVAIQLSHERGKAAKKLQKTVNQQLQKLNMKSALFHIDLKTDKDTANAFGIDTIEFLISTNPGQPVKSLGKVASGGELSRISLAIQVVAAQSSATPTLVFDEVDVGIGGATADTVGKLLQQLGKQGQVICVTHLPQVASKARQHLLVHKETQQKTSQSTLTELNGEDKILELARMMGGTELTQQTVAHAREMLELAG